jgi:hypothetical protein
MFKFDIFLFIYSVLEDALNTFSGLRNDSAVLFLD